MNDFSKTRENLILQEAKHITQYFKRKSTKSKKIHQLEQIDQHLRKTRCKKHKRPAEYCFCLEDKRIQVELKKCCCDSFENHLIQQIKICIQQPPD